jgi:PDZ domain-containing protein
VQEAGPSAAVLRAEDVITSLDGKPVTDAAALRADLRAHQPGDDVVIGFRRAGKDGKATVRTATSTDGEKRAVIGVELREDSEYPFTVTLKTDDVGGPSAGLMFALGIIEELTPGSMTNGVHVAGTGTISDDGVVGPIGGIQQKLIAAAKAGATHFLVPAGNFADAQQSAPDGLALHEVGSLKEALAALATIRSAQ